MGRDEFHSSIILIEFPKIHDFNYDESNGEIVQFEK